MFSIRAGFVCACGILIAASTSAKAEEAAPPTFHSDVDLVTVSFTVTDSHGRYIRDLKASDIRIFEDEIEQSPASFIAPSSSERATSVPVENSVFVLMDTSSAMYSDFMRANELVTDFVRNVHSSNAVAVYTFSRNMYRTLPLSHDPVQRVMAVRSPVLGDETAIFNALLLTIRDAARVPGNKTIVLLSNGPDTASIVSPDDVARVAREEGIAVHVIHTREKDALLNASFARVAGSTGGRSYSSLSWEQNAAALKQISDELLNSYTVAYYPRPTDNEGFRKIRIELQGDSAMAYRVRARPGYKPASTRPQRTCVNCSLARAAGSANSAATETASGIVTHDGH